MSPAKGGWWPRRTAPRRTPPWPPRGLTRSVPGPALIAEITAERPGLVLLRTAFGGTRVVDLLAGDPSPASADSAPSHAPPAGQLGERARWQHLKILHRSRRTSSSQRRQSTSSQASPSKTGRAGRRSSGPFTEVPNLPVGSSICSRFASKAHLPTSAPLQARASARIRPVMQGHPGGDPGAAAPVFLLPFGRRHSLPGHPVPPGASAPLTIGLPTGLHLPVPAGRTLTRFPRSACMRPGPGRAALYTPGAAVSAGR